MSANDSNTGRGVDPELIDTVSGMVATLPPASQPAFVDFIAKSYEAFSRHWSDDFVERQRRHRHRPGETSAEQALDELTALMLHSPVSLKAERNTARRVRSGQRLQRLLRGDNGEPPLSSKEMADRLGKRPQVVNRQAKAGLYVAALVSAANRFPEWQFTPDGRVPSRELRELFALFGETQRWPWIAFLRTPQPDLDECTPIDWLTSGRALAPVKRLAKKQVGLVEAL